MTGARLNPITDAGSAIDEAIIQALATGTINRIVLGFASKDVELAASKAQELSQLFSTIPSPDVSFSVHKKIAFCVRLIPQRSMYIRMMIAFCLRLML